MDGDAVRVKWSLLEADVGEPVNFELPFDEGEVRFVVGSGGYLPGLHRLAREGVLETEPKVFDIKAAEAFGSANPDLGPIDVPASAAPEGLAAGMVVQLQNGMKARVTRVTDEVFTIDANDELAGKDFKVEAALLEVDPAASKIETAHFALGCFWGGELAYQRAQGVVSTKVGYTQGQAESPSYEEVCSGSTGHTEAIQVMYDPSVVSYSRLLELFWERLGDSRHLLNQVGNDRGTQYRHGIYWLTEGQKEEAEASMAAAKELALVQAGKTIYTECKASETFYDAEEYHQQYLQKGGQSAKKQASETIRCYG
mmetsp:Transcript_19749/g.44782  ORF Transcript_19749/g.44782 Transcript_19749/m.44782 type:complete len:312 (+) Transcript_19749:348-1283(+)